MVIKLQVSVPVADQFMHVKSTCGGFVWFHKSWQTVKYQGCKTTCPESSAFQELQQIIEG